LKNILQLYHTDMYRAKYMEYLKYDVIPI